MITLWQTEKGVIENFELEFYVKENGKIPVQDFLYSLNPKLRAKAFSDIELLKNWVAN